MPYYAHNGHNRYKVMPGSVCSGKMGIIVCDPTLNGYYSSPKI